MINRSFMQLMKAESFSFQSLPRHWHQEWSGDATASNYSIHACINICIYVCSYVRTHVTEFVKTLHLCTSNFLSLTRCNLSLIQGTDLKIAPNITLSLLYIYDIKISNLYLV